MRKNLKIFFYLLLIVVTLVYFFSIINLGELLSVLSQLTLGLLFFLVVAQIITQTMLAYKWHLMANAMKYKITFARIFTIHLVGALVGNITPAAKIGGEPAQMYFLCKEGAALKDVLAITIIDKSIGILSFTAVLFAAFMYVAVKFTLPSSLAVYIFMLLLLIAILGGSTGIFFYMHEEVLVKILKCGLRFVNQFKPIRLDTENVISGFKYSMHKVMRHKIILAQSLFLFIVVWLLYPLKIYIIFHTLGNNVNFGLVAFVTLAAFLIGMISAIPGGIGLYEGSAIALYGTLGIPLAEATVAVIIGRVFTFWFVNLLGVLAAIGLRTWSKPAKQ